MVIINCIVCCAAMEKLIQPENSYYKIDFMWKMPYYSFVLNIIH